MLFSARREAAFSTLVAEAAACNLCPQMCERRAVLSELNGKPGARVLFIGEAPGRQGGDRTRVPFSGDQSFPHLKLLVVDGVRAYIGSANLTYAALTTNYEVGALVDGDAVHVYERLLDEVLQQPNSHS